MAAQSPIVGRTLGHYLVIEQIGAGGMGMVFRASDQQLERDVAIKVLPPGMLANESARKRFRREALTLAKLNHPNIGTVYEFGSEGGLDFLVMEYVGGVALDSKLGTGPLPQKDVLRLGFQLADGLASAHDHGVIHRDLKPANLRLTHDNRVKILDFGLAQFVQQKTDLSVTASVAESKVSGTLPYMAPEQLRGEVTDQRSDIWSAGAVLYELATGQRPFASSHPPVVIDGILNQQPELPSTLNPKISPGLEMVILKCLDKDPERRYQSARELKVDLDRLTMPVSQVPRTAEIIKPVPTRSRAKPAFLIAGAIVLAIAAVFAYIILQRMNLQRGPSQETVVKPIVRRRRTVAVLNFKNSTSRSESAWLSTALPEMLTTELAAGEQLRTITGDQVAQMKMNLSLPDSDTLPARALAQVGRALEADLLVLGSYVDLAGGRLRVDLHLLDVSSGETLVSVAQTGDENNLFDLVSLTGATLREKCKAGQVNPEEQAAIRAALPSNSEASKLYTEGLAKLRVNDAMSARDFLQKAVAADPNHALAHSALAAAWSLLGYDEKARLSAKNAYDLSASLSREPRLLIEARYREASKEWDNAAESYRTLFGFFPDNLEYGLLLARAQTHGGKGREALATIDSLRKLPSPEGDDARIDLTASETWRTLGDFKQSADLASQAAQKARARNLRMVLARALYQRAAALENLNDPQGALAAADEARRIYQSVDDKYGLASTLEITGLVLEDRGDHSGARAKFSEELAIAREVGNRKAEASSVNLMGIVLNEQGDADEARKMYEQALAIFREVSDKNNYAETLLNIAGIMNNNGDLVGATRTYDEALGLFREINDQGGIALSQTALAIVLDEMGDSESARRMLGDSLGKQTDVSSDKLIDLGDILRHLGDLPGAKEKYEDALSAATKAGDKSMAAYALAGLGNLELKAANFGQAHKDYQEALETRNQSGEKDTAASTRVAIAELDIEDGHPDRAEGPAREARDWFEKAHKRDDQTNASAILAIALLAEGKNEDALRELRTTASVAAKSQNLSSQLTFARAKARAKLATHDLAAARAIAKDSLATATKSGYLGDQLQFRLLLAEIEAKYPAKVASRSQLEQLQSEAKDKGFELIARQAANLQR